MLVELAPDTRVGLDYFGWADELSRIFGRKADLYAVAGVPEYWVVDLNENRVLMHANPRGDGSGYDGQLDVEFGTPLHAATVAGLSVESSGLA